MKKILLLLIASAFSITTVSGQSTTVIGTLNGENGTLIIGASIVIQGTTIGTVTDINGDFTLKTDKTGNQKLTISYIGFTTIIKEVTLNNGTVKLGTIIMAIEDIGLDEIVVLASIAIDRKTPVAVSTIKAELIEAKIGSQEFPEILKSTPGVYTTKVGGGYGDGRINLRGFNSDNVGVLINGVPVNDMENGHVYWSNWAGLSDAARNIQIQRGLGASKIALPSIGGTINIISKASDKKKGGNVYVGVGNNNYEKRGLVLSTGLMDNGLAVTISISETKGNGYVEGTQFKGFSYFANVSKKINNNHEIDFTIVGAKQRHGQRQSRMTVQKFEAAESGIRYNNDWGYLDGQVTHVEDNFYHKPQMSLNDYLTINDKIDLSTAIYYSSGTGGGGGVAGSSFNDYRTSKGYYDLEGMRNENQALASLGLPSSRYMRASRNDHRWYGILSTLNYELNSNLNIQFGVDGRKYVGSHFREITNLLGGDYVLDNSDDHKANRLLKVGDKFSYNNDGKVGWLGVFTQIEYSKDKLSAFATINYSKTTYQRVDFYNADFTETSDKVKYTNFGIKGGLNYNLTDNHNIFFNTGFFDKAPFFEASFQNFTNKINAKAENQKITSIELGYGYRSSKFNANVNIYRTAWKDRTFTSNFNAQNGERFIANILGVDALHQGIELDFKYTPISKLTLTGMASVGDWRWKNDLEDVNVFDDAQNLVGTVNLYIGNIHVGNAAQTTIALGAGYEIFSDFNIGFDFNYYDNLYASYDPTKRDDVALKGQDVWKLPAWGIVDLNVKYDIDIAGFNTKFFLNVNNISDTKYIADANDGGVYDEHDELGRGGQLTKADGGLVYYGFGRTWNLGIKLKF